MGGHKIGLRDPVRLIFETVVTVQTSVGDEGGRSTEDWRRLLFGHFFSGRRASAWRLSKRLSDGRCGLRYWLVSLGAMGCP